MDDNLGNYPQCNIVYDPNSAYGSKKVSSKLELQVLSTSFCEGNDTIPI